MLQTLNPSSYPSSKTDEIMSRYRPIAPKPELPPLSTTFDANGGGGGSSSLVVPEKFRQSPYLRNIWSHLQARPTRTRKRAARSSTPIPSASSILRKHHHNMAASGGGGGGAHAAFIGLCSAQSLSYQGFAIYEDPYRHHYNHHHAGNNNNTNNGENVAAEKTIVTLPLLTCTEPAERNPIDLNAAVTDGGVLEEKDLLLQLQSPTGSQTSSSSSKSNAGVGVISPRPVRPVGSSISVVGPVSEDPEAQPVVKAAEEVEAAAEDEELPVVISDRSNKVRMANAAYKELVGQPECPWLDSMVSSASSKRISGEVMLRLPEMPVSGNGFSCWVRIEWEGHGKNKCSVNAFCNVVRVVCESKDYVFSWRFHTREVSPSASKV